MEIGEFLSNLEKMNFSLSVDNEKLNLNANKNKVTKEQINAVKNNSEIINYIKTHKDELIQYISTIPKVSVGNQKNVVSIYRLSGLQEGMLFHSLYNEQFGSYIEQFTCDIIDADLNVLKAAWAEIIAKHTILRTGFYYESFSIPVQCVYRDVTLPVIEIDYSELDPASQTIAFDNFLAADRERGFDFNQPPLMRITLVKLDDSRYRMLWSFHHILFDGWSLPVLMSEFLEAYELLLQGRVVTQTPEDKYEDFIRYLERRDKWAEESYWRNYLQGISEGTSLPFVKKTNAALLKARFLSVNKVFDKDASALISAYVKKHRITLNTLMQGVWALLLNRYTGNADVLFGAVVSGRPDELPGVEHRVGLFINTIPFKASFDNQEIINWLQGLQADQAASRNYQHATLQSIKEWTGIKADLFDSLLVFENYPVNKAINAKQWSLKVENANTYEQTNYPLTILIADADGLNFTFNYNADLLETTYVQSIVDQFAYVLSQITEGIVKSLNDISILTPAEASVLKEFNNTAAPYPADKNLVSLFEEQVKKTPDAVAVKFEGDSLKYQELNRRSNQLARYLQLQGVVKETLVPICLERSFEMLIGILGILKAGGAYIPVDPEYPVDRIAYMLEDSAAKIVLSSAVGISKLQWNNLQVIDLDKDWELISKQDSSNLDTVISAGQLAYVIYTSGSTGKPKGAMNEHGGVVNRLNWTQSYFGLTAADTVLQKNTFSFDVSVWELLWPILTGAKLVFAKPGAQGDSLYLKSVIESQDITLLHFVPSMLSVFLLDIEKGDCPELKHVLCSGEALTTAQVKLFRSKLPHVALHNLYGPTEAAIDVTYWSDLEKDADLEIVPIGAPVSNTQIYIRSTSGQLSPIGVPGEICIGGVQVARGYLNQPELTKEKFINSPYSEDVNTRLYRTGDHGRWLADGNIEYLGRIDDQVKIRGYRIELGEIEQVLLQNENVRQAVVLARADKQGTKRLTAYVVMNEATYHKQELQNYLGERLPEYMVPRLWVRVDSLPLTPNGKTDKRALPEAEASHEESYTAPQTQTEKQLAKIWEELLGIEKIGTSDNFFELGGHSLLAMRVISQVRRELNKELKIRDLFVYPTIGDLAKQLEEEEITAAGGIIKSVNPRPEYIPLSYSQERLWFIDRLEGSVQYHIPAILKLDGEVNIPALESALKTVVERHEVLRTVIREHEGHGYQYVKANSWTLKQSQSSNNAELKDYISKEAARPFDLSQDDMLRAELIATGQDEYVLLLMLHHIVADGWSMPVLVSEFSRLYDDYNNNKTPELKAPEIQYADYAIWQREYLDAAKLQNKLNYWTGKLTGTATLELPTDHMRSAVQISKGAVYTFVIAKEQAAKLQKLSLEQGATLYMTLLSVFKVLLYRYSGQDDICVGTPVANRDREEIAELIGFFVNTLALRTTVNGEETFPDLLNKVKQTTLEAYDHQEVPFEKVVEAVVKERDLSRSPLFQVMFALQNTAVIPTLELGDIKITSERAGDQSGKYDLGYNVEETKDGIQIVAEYNTDLYEPDTIARMAGHYVELIKAVTEEPETIINKLQLLSKVEERELSTFNETAAEYPKEENIVSLFEKQASVRPEATALVFEGETVSYQALNEQSNKIAHYLKEQGVTKETPIAICVERGTAMIAGILGILKAGAAYVPIDIDYPKERISYILEDTKASIVLSSSTSKINIANALVIELDNNQEIANQSSDNLNIAIEPNRLAYIMYTSGSTGKPKGVTVEHQSITNYTYGFVNYFGITAADIVLQQSSVSFDTMCEEVYPALISGAKVVIVKEGGKDVDDIKHLLATEAITILSATPTVIAYLNKEAGNNNVDIKNLRYIISGGELLQPGFIDNLYPTVAIVNSYGPTEGTVCASYYTVDSIDKASLIGTPVSNTQIYIRSVSGELSPIGVPGEICIGGVQVARGYLNQPELTKEKFVNDPYSEEATAKLYRTGDQGRWLADGNIEYLGRIDDQVKIRGYRIEPGEIEQVLLQNENVTQAAVLARADKQGTKRLTAYVVMDEAAYDKQELQNYLGERLPEYMVPRLWVQMDSLPLTPNGKTDKRALPEAEASHEESYTVPQTQTEKQLAKIWEELLGVERIGIKDNFFELGGHSLLAMRVISQVRRELNKELKIRDLFVFPTIGDLAKQLEGDDTEVAGSTIKSISPRPEYIPLSYSQERLWFIDRLEGSVQYHIPGVLKLEGYLDAVSLEQAIREVVNRHEILRTVIREHDGHGFQFVKPVGHWGLAQTSSLNEAELKSYIGALIEQPFDLSADDMLRAALIRIADNSHVLVMVIHHIASDAWSLPIIVDEIATLYSAYSNGNQLRLAEPTLQFADYAIWQRDNLLEEKVEEKLQYWKSKLQDVTPLQLPADFVRPTNNSSKGATLTFNIDKQLSNNLQLLSQEHGATLYMTLLSVFNILMYRYSGQDDICVGTSIAGRPNPELERLIGFFVNTLALRNQVNSDESFIQLLSQVKQTTLEAYEHQEVPFEKVVEAVVKERTAGVSPLFQVMLVLGNTPTVPELKLSGLELVGFDYEQSAVKFDLTFFVSETPEGLQCAVQYRTDIFSAVRIETMVGHFCTLLASAISAPEMQIGKLQMLDQLQKENLLTQGSSVCLYPLDKTIADIFEAVVLKSSETNAVTFEGQSISFEELDKRSNRLAHHLKRYGVGADTMVPLYIERGISMIVGIMGILKAGAAYVPVDTDYPLERVNYILEDTNAKIAVSSPKFAGNLADISEWLKVVELDEQNWELAAEAETNTIRAISPDNLAYVIYTSGSTGKPKGVQITQRNIVDYVYGLDDRTSISACKSFGLMSTIATDLGNTVLYSSLLFGGTLHVFSKETLSHIEALYTYFEENRIDCIKIVPSHWKAISADEPLVPARMLVFGGESLSTEIISKIRQYSDCRIINHYGPTETTIGKLLYEVTDSNYTIIPIGRPFSNTQSYVLNKDLQQCPVGVPGQLFIAGTGLAKGYQNQPELTRERFIANPYGDEGTLIYQTGDAVQYNTEGNIEYLGRVDDQVKIRGYRVEPGEVSRILEQSKLVSQAIVMARRDKQGNNQLVGYVVVLGEFDRSAIINWLKEQLPEYMVPTHLIELKEIPLTAAGKINRKQLPDPEVEVSAKNVDEPVGETELKLAAIWQDILEIDSIGVHDDFFELGGHSLLAVRLISAVRKAFTVELPISDVFDYPTVSKLSARLNISETSVEITSIGTQVRPEHIPLSFSQERMWFIDRLEGSVQYHVPAVLRLNGNLNIPALTQAFRQIVNRHEVLRTVIREHEGRGYQYIKPGGDWLLEQTSEDKIEAAGTNLQDYVQRQINRPFNLSQDDMLRCELIQTGNEAFVLLLTMHHIASDGWSTSILVNELGILYQLFAKGVEVETSELPALPIQYADYAIWQRNHLQAALLEQKLSYWKDKLEGISAIQLPTDYRRPVIRSNQGLTEAVFVNKELVDRLNALGRKQGTTLYMTLLSAFMVLLHRYSGQQDISVGTPVSGRSHQEIEGLIGFFINTLVLRNNVQGGQAFTKLLEEVKSTTLEAYNHQEVPFEKVVEAVVKERDMSHSPLFQVMFTLQNTPEIPELKLADVTLSAETAEDTTSKFDISLNLVETADGLVGGLTYNTDLFKAETMERMIGHYTAILQSVVQTPTEIIGRINMLSAIEEEEQLKTFNATDADYPTDRSVLDILGQQVAQTPDAIAVTFEDETLTYRQLNDKANSLAKYLQVQGVKTETIIPICTKRSIEMIIGILGVMKAGGVYVPFDPEYPQDRIDYMLKDTAAGLVVSSSSCSSKFAKTNIQVVELDRHWAEVEKYGNAELNASVNAGQLAYIIYTSGSTGRPKGVMIEHRGVVNLVLAYKRDLNLKHGTRFLQFASFGFDASCVEIFSTLLTGGCLVMCTKESLLSADSFEQLLTKQQVEIAILPPAFQPFVENVPHTLKIIISAGEALNEATGKLIQSKGITLVNGYGPTESTVCASQTHNPIRPDGIITIGKPIDNVKIYILNKENQLSPVGVTGEICIGGVQVARGYLNQPELTNEKFIKDPFSDDASARLYRTGDLGRWLADGDIEYLGRMDDQVKIRGFRIELGEIENVLLQSGLVSQAIVLSKPDVNGVNRLIAYVTTEGAYDKQALISYLTAQLPEYMVPKLWVLLDKFPVTTHGKIDKRSLPDVDMAEQLTYNYVAPRNKIEEGLAAIWQRLLGIDRISIHDNFFELGGHSILAMRLIAAVKKEMAINITIRDLFLHPTIAKLYRRSQNQNIDLTQSLIPIKTTGNKTPLYIICGAGGTAFKFKEFVKLLDAEQPVYGLQQPLHINNPADFPDTIEGIAERYVTEMLLDNPYGPYALAGHCLGGMIAVEMANQLQAMGKKISMLAMFDADAKPLVDAVADIAQHNNNNLPSLVKRSVSVISTKLKFEIFLLMKHPKQALMYKVRKIGPLFSNTESKLANIDQDIFDKITLQIKTAADKYQIKPYNGEIVLFNATQQYYFIDRVNKIIYKELEVNSENKHAWKNYAQSIKIHEVKGEHSTIFDELNAREFSEILQHYLG